MASARVLIIDDDEGICLLLSRVCRREGHTVALAGDANGAFDLLGETTFDVLICDLDLPGPSGIEILRHSREVQPEAKVVILTGHGNTQTAIDALRLGAFDYFQKPLDDVALIPLTIARAMGQLDLERSHRQLLVDLQEANREIEHRRRQQLEIIRHIGDAFTGALNPEEVARVFVQAILSTTASDAAAILLLPDLERNEILAMTAAPRTLSSAAAQQLVDAMVRELPKTIRVEQSALDLHSVSLSPQVDDLPWRNLSFARLSVRETLLGIAALAWHDDRSPDESQLDVYGVLVAQGAIALDNAHLFVRTQDLATRDSLTGVYNHGHFFELLDAEISRSERHGYSLAVIMLDIDRAHGLKRINDTYGHLAGDAFLRHVAQVIVSNVRLADTVARYGGDEFIVLAPQTCADKAVIVANRLCRVIRESLFTIEGNKEYVTVSVGVAVFAPGTGETASILFSRVDKALYAAKDRHGNQACMADRVPAQGAETET